MQQIVIDAVDTAPMEQERNALVAAASVAITSKEEHAEAGAFLKRLAAMRKGIVDLFAKPKADAHAAHKSVVAAEAALLAPVEQARVAVERQMSAYEMEQRRIADAERRRLEDIARREAEERRRQELARIEEEQRAAKERAAAEAKAAKAAGDDAEAKRIRAQAKADAEAAEAEKAAVAAEPIEVPIIAVAPRLARTEGVSSSERWSAEVTDLPALIKHVAARVDDDPGIASLLLANGPALNRLAVSQRAQMRVPGVRAVSTTSRAVRA